MMQSDWHPADIISRAEKTWHFAVSAFPSGRAGILHAGKCAYPPLA